MSVGPVLGLIMMMIIVVDYLFLRFLQWWKPEEDIERAVDFKRDKYFSNLDGDHEFSVRNSSS